MYEHFYGLREKPFSLLPDPEFLFLSKKHRMALTMLEYGVVNQAGFSIVTGEVGAGKTTLVRKLIRQVHSGTTVGVVSNSQCDSFAELMRWILFAFELEYKQAEKVEMFHAFVDFLVATYRHRKRAILIIDEAQHLDPEKLESLRMLSNVNVDKHQVLQVMLVGQPGLRDLLHRPELEQFAQRVAVDYHLEPLDLDEAIQYIGHRLRVAGGDAALFTEAACERVWQATRGIPRLINIVCDTALVYGFADQKRTIDANLVRDAIDDKRMSLSPIRQDDDTAFEQASTIDRLFRR